MRLDQLLVEIENIVVRQSVDKADEIISILFAVTRALSLHLDRRDEPRSVLLRRINEETLHSCATVRDHPRCEDSLSHA